MNGFAQAAKILAVITGVLLLFSFVSLVQRFRALPAQAGVTRHQSPAAAPGAQPTEAGVVCDRFLIVNSRRGDTLTVSLDTDLPDFTDVMVTVSRSYFEKNDPEEYPLDYLSEKSTVDRWRKPRHVAIPHKTFQIALSNRLRETALAGLSTGLRAIAEDVVIGFTVPINQSNPAFGTANRNLTGRATFRDGNRTLVRERVRVRFPIR